MGTDLLPFDEVTALIATVSVIGLFLLTPLYLSQRRDVQRLREWMLKNPEHATTDLALSESRLDRTEVELEKLYAERGEPVPGTDEQAATEVKPGVTPPGSLPAATRVTSERPALERITMERSTLEPHHQMRRFGRWATQPRWLAALAVAALLIAAGAIVVVQQGLLEDDEPDAAAVNPAGIEVAVLNTTPADGLAGKVSRQIENAGFLPGDVESFVRDTDQTVVMYQRGQERAAKRVARELGDPAPAIQRIDRDVQDATPEADVVVILGQDRVGE
jgi:LytR cell envelope-related transcriptional attenuator